jgi:hypothetical protein
MFYDTGKRQTDLRIRLRFDGLNQSKFFRAMITGYLEKDSDLMCYLDNYIRKNKLQGINKRDASRRLIEKGREAEKMFSLNEEEVENIFDIIEEEHPDL